MLSSALGSCEQHFSDCLEWLLEYNSIAGWPVSGRVSDVNWEKVSFVAASVVHRPRLAKRGPWLKKFVHHCLLADGCRMHRCCL